MRRGVSPSDGLTDADGPLESNGVHGQERGGDQRGASERGEGEEVWRKEGRE